MRTSHRKIVRFALLALALALGAAQAWTWRFTLVNDTVSYLDMGENFFNGHPSALVNGLWSPLYAFLLGLTVGLGKPTIYAEYPEVHLLLFLIFALSLVCFDLFLHELIRFRDVHFSATAQESSDVAWLVIAYVFFLWTSLQMIGVQETNPDMLVAAFVYFAFYLLLRIADGSVSWATYSALGLVLGLGYLTKFVMLPLSLTILGAAALLSKKKPRRVLAATVVLVLIASPLVIALSRKHGRITFGESGRYNYAIHVDKILRDHWQGEDPREGTPLHPTRKIFAAPPTFEFADPAGSTYPVWYDPAYWYEGVQPRFHLHNQLKALVWNGLSEFMTCFYGLNSVFFITIVLAFCASKEKLQAWRICSRFWFLILLPAMASVLYMGVHYEPRYLGSFFCVLGVALFSSLVWSDDGGNRRLFSGIALLQLGMILWWSIPLLRHVREIQTTSSMGSNQDVAIGAQAMGLRPGDPIASLCFSNIDVAMWAHLARVRIVAEVYIWPGGPEGAQTSFWSENAATQAKLLDRLSATGAKAIVSSDAPTGPDAARWSRIGRTDYYLLWVNPRAAALQH